MIAAPEKSERFERESLDWCFPGDWGKPDLADDDGVAAIKSADFLPDSSSS
jgi:hypothetical protein